jgi:VWFA-related protein
VGALLAVPVRESLGQESGGDPPSPPATTTPNEPETSNANTQEMSDEGLPVFRGEYDVSLINLFITVVDGDGKPVTGLTRDDFEVFENGKRMEITNFEAIQRRDLEAVDVEEEEAAEVESAATLKAPEGRYVAILIDNMSLERKSRKRVLKALESFIDEGLQQNDQFMIALNTGKLEILKSFTANESGLKATLRSVAEIPSAGDALKKHKRMLKRSVYNTEIFSSFVPPTFENFNETSLSISRARGLYTEILNMRQKESVRIRQSLQVSNELLQALAGLDGRKAVIWVGEDLAIRPAIDIYTVYYSRAAPLREVMIVDPPEIWGQQEMLDYEFASVAATAQASGATIYMIDASDRDREVATADYSPPNAADTLFSENSEAGLWTPGVNLAEYRDLSEGGNFMAVATGGESFGDTRAMGKMMDTISDRVSTYYYIGYRRDGPPDGARHDIKIRALHQGQRVRHHEQVFDKTAPQRLADLAMSRLRLDMGDNDLDLSVALDRPEPYDKNTYLLPIQLMIPVDKLVLMPEAENHIGQILVAVAVLDDKGDTAPVHLMRLRLTIPFARYEEGAIASRSINLRIKEGTSRIAVGVRDEVSGIQSSQAIAVPAIQAVENAASSGKNQEVADSAS